MFGGSKTIVTLNIEYDSARLLSVKGGKIDFYKSVPLTADSVRDTSIDNAQAVSAALTHFMFKSAKVTKNNVIASVTGLRSVYRIVPLPKIKSSKVKEAIQWIAMKEIPFDLKDAHLFWQILGEKEGEQHAFLIATPKQMLRVVEDTLSKAGITLKSLDLKPLALARYVNKPDCIILDMEIDSNSIVIMKNGLPQVMHTIVIPQQNQSSKDRAMRLGTDLSRTVMFYNNAHENDPIEPLTEVCVTGKLGADDDMIGLLKACVDYPMATPELCLEHADGFSASEYAVNIGLALKEKSFFKQGKEGTGQRCPVNINLLPSAKQFPK